MGVKKNERKPLAPEFNGIRPPSVIAIENFDDEVIDDKGFKRYQTAFTTWWYTQSPNRKIIYLSSVALAIVGIVVGITIGVTSGGNGASAPVPSPVSVPMPTNSGPLLDDPADRESNIMTQLERISSSAELEDHATPQYKASRWIIDIDPLKVQSRSASLQQRYASTVLFFALNGTAWKNPWIDVNDSSTPNSECLWYGVECDQDNQIQSFFLNENGLKGQLPSKELAALSHLKKIDFRGNTISGTVPNEIGELSHLTVVLLSENDLKGTIPSDVCRQVEWMTADCSDVVCDCCANCNGNNITIGINGPVLEGNSTGRVSQIESLIRGLSPAVATVGSPQSLALNWILYGDSRKLSVLDDTLIQRYVLAVIYYSLGGASWPFASSWLTDSGECRYPGVACNEFGFVTTIAMVGSNLKGTLPQEIGLLDELAFLDLSDNKISGVIPVQLAELDSLQSLLLQDNALVGNVPSQICQLREAELKEFKTDCAGSNPSTSCNCCTNCDGVAASEERSSGTGQSLNDVPKLDYLALFGRRGQLVAGVLQEVSEDVYVPDSVQADTTEWILKIDPMGLDHGDARLVQRWILALLYFQFDGSNWSYKNYLNGNDECEWDQITCNDNGDVIEIKLVNGGLIGEVPYELGALDELQVLDLHGNFIEGQAPEEFCVEETDSTYALETLIFDCMYPPLVDCDCCTPCSNDSGGNMTTMTPKQQSIDYKAKFGNRGQRIVQVLQGVSEDIYSRGTSRAAAAEWIIKVDSMSLEHSDPLLVQRFVLALLYFELDGQNWVYKHFLKGDDECNWDGITCNEKGEVTEISLPDGGLMGAVPYELGALDNLKVLDMHGNRIEGQAPEEFCVEETDSSYALETLIFDCTEPPLVDCDCCTPCSNDTRENATTVSPKLQSINYKAKFGSRGQQIAQVLGGVSEDIYSRGTSRAAAVEWIIKVDSMSLEHSDPHLVQRFVLALLYFELDGQNWVYKHFLKGDDECNWDGITCNEKGEVTEISLPDGGLMGAVPYELGALDNLTVLDMHGNRIEGQAPEEFCVEETDSSYALETLIFDCTEPPLVDCDCCTPCKR